MSFVNEDLNIYFGTDPQSQKIRNIARDPRVSATVTPDYETSSDIQAISLAAEAERVTDAMELSRVVALVLEKFPRPGHLASTNVLKGLTIVRLRPSIVSVLDYSRKFSQTDLIDLREDRGSPDSRNSRLP